MKRRHFLTLLLCIFLLSSSAMADSLYVTDDGVGLNVAAPNASFDVAGAGWIESSPGAQGTEDNKKMTMGIFEVDDDLVTMLEFVYKNNQYGEYALVQFQEGAVFYEGVSFKDIAVFDDEVTLKGDVVLNDITASCPELETNGSKVVVCDDSSMRYKMDIRAFDQGLAFVQSLEPKRFRWNGVNLKEKGAADIGLIAEQVEKVDPEFTFRNAKGQVEGVHYKKLVLPLINAIKEQQRQIEQLNLANDELQARVDRLEKATELDGSIARE